MNPGDSHRIVEAGDSALLLELGHAETLLAPDAIRVELNARAIAVANLVRQRRMSGVRDVIPAYRSVAVFFDVLNTDVEEVARTLDALAGLESSEEKGRLHEVPVTYGGAAGPDLGDVAAFAGCSPEAVIERHTAATYRVFMLGFLPGFPYMASVDASIAAPRRATPRVRVPAGSVGVAGRQTGIYPRESPGGWQIIGRTAVELFDQEKDPPALMAPGDLVRFVPVSDSSGAGLKRPPRRPQGSAPQAGAITVLRAGLLTTIQDNGRWGYQSLGVPVSGAMDPFAHRLANALVHNEGDAATLEVTLLGPELRFDQSVRVAVAGGDLAPMLNDAPLPMQTAVACGAGDVLRFGARRSGARAYLAVAGGIDVPPVLGSRATHLLGALGGVDGRALRAGDRLPVGLPASPGTGLAPHRASVRGGGPAKTRPYILPRGGARLRVRPGPQAHFFDAAALTLLQRARFTISPQSDRMGYRLTGARLPVRRAGEMISDATFVGALQVPPAGDPILLMADRQTTGGYPQLAVVITADLGLAAQLAPGDWVEFEMCSRSDAVAALREQEGQFRAVD